MVRFSLRCADEEGREHALWLMQRMNPCRETTSDEIAGRLYFDSALVAIRSETEREVVRLLAGARSRETDELNSRFISQIIEFVTSEEYVRFAAMVERAREMSRDVTLYTAWSAWSPATRGHALVRLARVEGIGLRVAQERLTRPLAENVPALEIGPIVGKYLIAGITVRIEPPFRWTLI